MKNFSRELLLSLAGTMSLLIVYLAFYPGYMSEDSFYSYSQMLSGLYSDWNPPIMAFVWKGINFVIPGPPGLLFFHNFLFWSGLTLLVYFTAMPLLAAVFFIFLVGFTPSVFGLLSTLWKDVGFGASLFFATGTLVYAEKKHSKLALLLGLCGLFYGLAVRHNGLVAVAPLCLWAGVVLAQLFPHNVIQLKRLWQKALLGIPLFLILAITTSQLNHYLTQGESGLPVQQIMLHDLTAISIQSNENQIPLRFNFHRELMSIDILKGIYSPQNDVPLFDPAANGQCLQPSQDPKDLDVLIGQWLYSVKTHPIYYLIHRWKAFKALFAIGTRNVCFPYSDGIVSNPYGYVVRPSILNKAAMKYLNIFRNQLPFRGYLYLFLIPALVFFLFKKRTYFEPRVLAVSTSGIFYAVTYFFVATTCDFRLIWWTVLSTWILFLFVFFPVRSSKHRTS